MKHAKTINISDQYNQFIWAFNVIIFKIKKNIETFKKNISIVFSLKQLKNKKNTWHQIYNRKFEFNYNKFYEKYQFFHFKRYDHDAHEKFSQINVVRENFFQKFLSKSKKNEKKNEQIESIVKRRRSKKQNSKNDFFMKKSRFIKRIFRKSKWISTKQIW